MSNKYIQVLKIDDEKVYLKFDDEYEIYRNIDELNIRLDLDIPNISLYNRNVDKYDLIINFDGSNHLFIHYFDDEYYLTYDDCYGFYPEINSNKFKIKTN